jgi:hypothetical protein
MTYDAYSPQPLANPRRRNVWLERLLLAAFILCLLVGLGALGIWWTLRDTHEPVLAGDSLAAVRIPLVLPQLALRQLAGDVPDGLAVQAMQAGEHETARAILTYDTGLSATARVARLAQLGKLYQEAGDTQAAAETYRLVLPAALLDASLSSLERAQLLAQTAAGLLAAGQPVPALTAATQAQRVATQAPDLLPAQRKQVFDELRRLTVPLKNASFTQQVDDLARNPFLSPQGVLIPHRPATFAQPLPYDDATQAAIAARQQAARLLADRIALTNGVDIDPERQALAQALLAEDQARTQFYQATLAGQLSLPQQTWLLQDQIAWLATKLRIARQGYGISLLPEWELRATALMDELGQVFNNYATALDGYAAAQPTPLDQALQRVQNQHWLSAQAERGLYTAISMNDLSERVRIVQDDVANQGSPLALPVAFEPEGVPPGFRVQAPGQ